MFYRKTPFSQPFFWLVVLCAAMVLGPNQLILCCLYKNLLASTLFNSALCGLGSCTYPGSPSVTPTTTSTNTATPSPIPTDTPTPTATQTSTNTPTPTAEAPSAIVTAYLYSHGLYEGDHVTIDGRNYNGTWLWVQPHNLARHCWSAASRFRMMQAAHNLPAVCCTL